LKNDRWEQLKDIFQAALDRPAAGREQFLSEACRGDNDMREEVRLLLSSFDEDGDFMESPAIGEVAETIAQSREVLKKGQQIERYRVVERIGAGGMGEVFLAFDTELERPAALKVLTGTAAGDESRVRRFIREAKAASALNHPNILTIYEILRFENSHIIATEFIEGETLRERQKRQPMSPSEVIDTALQVGAALNAAHAAGIVHRDIKPENIMLRNDGLVKVLDFGLAKLTDRKNSAYNTDDKTLSAVTDPGIVMGTVSYMAPEQLRGAADIDSRADIWSLGVVLFETLSGTLPFTGGSTNDVIAAILTNEPPALPGAYPPELTGIIVKSLQKERPERYSDIGEVIRDLKNVTGDIEPRTIKIGPRRTTQAPDRTARVWSVHRLWYLFPVVLLAVAITGAAWWFFARGSNTPPSYGSNLKSVEVVSWSSSPGESQSAGTFSPDGKMVAFAASRSGRRNIWIKQVTSGEAIQVTKDEFDNQNPIWSPDGTELAYFSNRGSQYGIWRIPVFGGSPSLIATVDFGGVFLKYWSPKNLIYYHGRDLNLITLDIDSLRTNLLTDLDPKQDMSISPNEELIAYVPSESENRIIRITSLKDGVSKDVSESAGEIQNIVWHRDSKLIFFNVTVRETLQIFTTDIYGTLPKQLTFGTEDSVVLDVSPDGTILYGSAREESDVWTFNLASSKEVAVASGIDSELWGTASPDGKTIAYQSVKNLGHGSTLFTGSIMTRRTGSDEPPTQLVKSGFLPLWSPDGQQIAFVQNENDRFYIKAIDAQGGEQKILTVDDTFPFQFSLMPYNRTETREYSWSPDSRRIAYRSKRGGQDNIWIVNVDGSGDFQFTQNNNAYLSISCPLWSVDGTQIAYASKTTRRSPENKITYTFLIADTETQTSKVLFQTTDFTRLINWTQNGEELILASGPGDPKTPSSAGLSLFRVSLKTRRAHTIAAVEDASLFNTSLSDDRKQLIFVANRDGTDNIWMVPAGGGTPVKITGNNDPRYYFSSLSSAGGDIFYDKQMRYNILSILTDFK
jgi:serine/threonine protein kinase